MKSQIPIAVFGFDEATRARIAARLGESPIFEVVCETAETNALESALLSNPRLALYLDLDADPDKGLSWLEALPEPRPAVLAGGPEAPELILRSMRAGAVAFFPGHQLDDELDRVAARLVVPEPVAEESLDQGRVIAVLGAKGGVGATTLACELAAALQREGERVALVDAKPYFGDVALHLDIEPEHTLGDPVARGQELDESFLEIVTKEHPASGVAIVAAPIEPDEAEGVDGAHLQRVCTLLRGAYDVVVVDLPRLTDDISLGTLDVADQVVLVTVPSLAGVARARQHQAFLAELGVAESRIRLVLNQAKRGDLFADDPSEAAGLTPTAVIPFDVAIAGAAEAGRPLLAKSVGGETAAALSGLAAALRTPSGEETVIEEDRGLRARIRRLVEDVQCRLASA